MTPHQAIAATLVILARAEVEFPAIAPAAHRAFHEVCAIHA